MTHFFTAASLQVHTPHAVAIVKLPFKQRLSESPLSLLPSKCSDCDTESAADREKFLHTFVTKEFVHPPFRFNDL